MMSAKSVSDLLRFAMACAGKVDVAGCAKSHLASSPVMHFLGLHCFELKAAKSSHLSPNGHEEKHAGLHR